MELRIVSRDAELPKEELKPIGKHKCRQKTESSGKQPHKQKHSTHIALAVKEEKVLALVLGANPCGATGTVVVAVTLLVKPNPNHTPEYSEIRNGKRQGQQGQHHSQRTHVAPNESETDTPTVSVPEADVGNFVTIAAVALLRVAIMTFAEVDRGEPRVMTMKAW